MILDRISRLHLYESEIPGAAQIEKAFFSEQPSAAPCEVREKGYFCAIFPKEAHMVGGKTSGNMSSVTKWVVKVPCTEVFSI